MQKSHSGVLSLSAGTIGICLALAHLLISIFSFETYSSFEGIKSMSFTITYLVSPIATLVLAMCMLLPASCNSLSNYFGVKDQKLSTSPNIFLFVTNCILATMVMCFFNIGLHSITMIIAHAISGALAMMDVAKIRIERLESGKNIDENIEFSTIEYPKKLGQKSKAQTEIQKPENDEIKQLVKINKLLKNGLITQEQFDTLKLQIIEKK